MHTSFRQILLHTALKILAMRQHACGFLPCLQQNYARKSAYISYEDRFSDLPMIYGVLALKPLILLPKNWDFRKLIM